MQVLQLLPAVSSASGGPVRSTLAACRALHRVDPGLRTTLATTDHGLEPDWRARLEERLPEEMELEVFPAVGRGAFLFSPRLQAWLDDHLLDYDLAVIRALFHPVSSAAARAAQRHGVPYLVVPHGTLSRYTFAHRRTLLKRIYFALIERRTLAGAAAIRFTCEREREEAPVGDIRTSGQVVPHPYEPRFRTDEGADRDPHQVLFLSRFHPGKGLEPLLHAMDRVRRELPDVRLVAAGSGSDKHERWVRKEVERLGLTDAVELPGFVEGEEKASLLARSAVFVLPSRHENFGIATVEAMDAGLPVAISRGVGIWQEVDEAGAGLVVEREPGPLADALVSLLEDPELRRRMGASGRELVAERYDPERIGEQLLSLYRSTMEFETRTLGTGA